MDRKLRRRRERMLLAAASQPFTLNASALVQIEAAPGSDPDAPVAVSIDAYNGGVMSVTGIGPLVCDVTGVQAEGPVVLLDGHTNTLAATLGSATAQVVNGQRLVAAGRISRTNAIAATAIRLAAEGVPLQASIGAEPLEPPVRIRPGETVEVNGRSITAGPAGFLLFKATRLRHIAILPNGADASTVVSIAAEAAANPESSTVNFQQWVESLGFVYADLTPEQTAALQVAYDEVSETEEAPAASEQPAEPVAAAASTSGTAAAAVASIRAEVAAEAERIAMIHAACGSKHASIAAEAIAKGWDQNKVELEVIRASRPNVPAIHTRENTVNEKIIEASLCMAAGIPVEAAGFSEETLDRAHKLRRRGLRWHAEQIAAAKGVSIDADPGSLEWIKAAFSTSELSGIVGNVANKALQTAFTATPSVAPRIAAKRSHNNFQANTVYSLALNGELQPVSKDGELKHMRLTEESRTRQVSTRGAVISISRTDLINDDLNAFADMAQALGRKAAHSRERAVFTALNATGNGASFFTTARANYFEGAATNLQSSSLATAVQMFRDQVGPDGLPILVEPAILLTGTPLEVTAKELMSSQYLLGPTAGKNPNANVWQGAFDPVVSPWLSNTAAGVGGSATAWYLLGSPSDLAAVEIAYLGGLETPTVEFFGMDTNPEVLGVSWRVFYDFGVALGEYRAGVKSKGAA